MWKFSSQTLNKTISFSAAKKYYTKEGAIFDGELPMKTTTEAFEPIDIFAEEDDDDWEWDWNDE